MVNIICFSLRKKLEMLEDFASGVLVGDQEFIWIWHLIGFCQLLGRGTVNKTKTNTICGAHHYEHTQIM